MPRKKNPYLSPQDIVALLSPQQHLPISPSALTNHSPSLISAFGNSLIVDLILEYLSSKDIGAYRAVCKTWNAVAQSHRWRSISVSQRLYDGYNPHVDRYWSLPYFWWATLNNDKLHNRVPRNYFNGRPTLKPVIYNQQKELVRRNIFRVRSLKIDYSGHSLLDLPFTDLTRFCMDCRYGFTRYPIQESIVTANKDQQFKEAALQLIAQNPRLQDIDISYVENLANPRERDPSLSSFAISVLLALRQPHQKHQSSSSSSITVSSSSLYSLKLVCHGAQSLENLCSIIENCPPSLKELTLQSHCEGRLSIPVSDPVIIQRRLESIKNNSNSNSNSANPSTNPSTNPSASRHQRVPSLRLLGISWIDLKGRNELAAHNPGFFFYPLLSCFPDLQELYVPYGITHHYNSEGRLSHNCTDKVLISTLALNCPALTTINFGYNLIAEEHMFRFVKLMPEALQELTTKIEPGYFDRVIPTLLRRSGPSLQVLRFNERHFDGSSARSTYIADILSACPRLKTLVVLPPWGCHTGSIDTNVGLQDLLGAEWVCSGLETLSICIRDLAEYEIEQELDKDGNHSSPSDTDAELALYLRQIHNVSEFHRRLKAMCPSLQTLDLTWNPLCQDISYDPYSHDISFPDNLRWMNLKWFPVSGSVKSTTTALEVVIQRQLEKKSDLSLQRKLQDSGIFLCEIWTRNYGGYPFYSNWYYGSWEDSGYENYSRVDYLYEEVSFDDVHDAYKSRSSRRIHEEMKRKK